MDEKEASEIDYARDSIIEANANVPEEVEGTLWNPKHGETYVKSLYYEDEGPGVSEKPESSLEAVVGLVRLVQEFPDESRRKVEGEEIILPMSEAFNAQLEKFLFDQLPIDQDVVS